MAISNDNPKREWQKPEIVALKVDLRSVAQSSGLGDDVHKSQDARAS